MKKQLLFFIAMLMPIMANAYDFEVDGIFYTITSIEDKVVEVTYSKEQNYQQTKVVIPSEVDWNGYHFFVKSISAWAFDKFNYPNKVDSLIISKGVERIGENAFQSASFKMISIPNTIKEIGMNAFGNNNSHFTDWYVEDWVWLCSSGLFNSWIAKDIYVNNVKLSEDLVIPDGVKFISRGNFAGLNWIKSLKISGSVEYIDAGAFGECANLKTVELEEGVKELYGEQSKDKCAWYGTGTFAKCYQLKTVILPSSISVLGDGAFSDSPNLKEIDCYINDPFPISSCFSNGQYLSATLTVPHGTKAKYMAVDGWKNFVNIQERDGDSTPEIPKCATPTIAFKEGRLVFDCETEGVEFVYRITPPASIELNGNNLVLPSTYTVIVYAKKDGYLNSETITEDIDVRGVVGDMNEDGTISVTDVGILITKILAGE